MFEGLPLVGSVVAGYRLESVVGSGGTATVYRARDERLDRPVALKLLAAQFSSDPAFRQRFLAESRMAAAVDDPHVIPVYEAGDADGILFIAMRYVRGGDLRQVMSRHGALPADRCAGLVSPIGSALDAVHRARLVHRDVKPENILVDTHPGRPDHPYLSDFGISRHTVKPGEPGGGGPVIGILQYMAPERITGGDADGRADQYSLACIAYELLTGQTPFEGPALPALIWGHVYEQPPSLTSRRPDLPASADLVFARALAKDPEERHASCSHFASALRDALGLPRYSRDLSAAARGGPQTAAKAREGPAVPPALPAEDQP